ncbi:MAG: hypothetical protein ACOC29_00820 [Candidatus Sumerlaeota bacterium]
MSMLVFGQGSLEVGPGKAIGEWKALGLFDGLPFGEAGKYIPLSPDGAPREDLVVWQNGDPHAWFETECDTRPVDVRAVFGPLRQGDTAFFYRKIEATQSTRLLLSVSANGPVSVWINGRRLRPERMGEPPLGDEAAAAKGFWALPGQDAFLEPLELERGEYHLIVRVDAPVEGDAWTFSARLVDPINLRQGKGVEYPRWQIVGANDGIGVRLGDPVIEQFLGLEREAHISSKVFTTETQTGRIGEIAGFIAEDSLANDILLVERKEGQALAIYPADLTKSSLWKNLQGNNTHAQSLRRQISELAPARRFDRGELMGVLRSSGETAGAWRAVDGAGYLLFETVEGEADGLVLVAGWPETDPWSLLPVTRELRDAARMKNIAVALAPGAGIEKTLQSRDFLQTVTADVRKALGLRDEARLILAGFGQSGPLLLEGVFEGRHQADALLLVEPVWDTATNWTELLHILSPRPDVLILSREDAAPAILDAGLGLEKQQGLWQRVDLPEISSVASWNLALENPAKTATDAAAKTVVIGGYAGLSPVTHHWLTLDKALDWQEPAYLECDLLSTNSMSVDADNVASFVLHLDAVPMIDATRPVVLHIEQHSQRQRLSLVGPNLPDKVSISLRRTSADAAPLWRATVGGEKREEKPRQICNLKSDTPALANSQTGGMAQFLGLAAREQSRSELALIPAQAMRSGLAAGAVYPEDVLEISTDETLTTFSITAYRLLPILEMEYARQRRWVTTGLDARIAGGPDPIENAGSVLPTTPVSNPRIFNTELMTDPDRIVTLVGWAGHLGGFEGVGQVTHSYDRLGQREALLQYFREHYLIDPPKRDIRPLPRIRARQLKYFVR